MHSTLVVDCGVVDRLETLSQQPVQHLWSRDPPLHVAMSKHPDTPRVHVDSAILLPWCMLNCTVTCEEFEDIRDTVAAVWQEQSG